MSSAGGATRELFRLKYCTSLEPRVREVGLLLNKALTLVRRPGLQIGSLTDNGYSLVVSNSKRFPRGALTLEVVGDVVNCTVVSPKTNHILLDGTLLDTNSTFSLAPYSVLSMQLNDVLLYVVPTSQEHLRPLRLEPPTSTLFARVAWESGVIHERVEVKVGTYALAHFKYADGRRTFGVLHFDELDPATNTVNIYSLEPQPSLVGAVQFSWAADTRAAEAAARAPTRTYEGQRVLGWCHWCQMQQPALACLGCVIAEKKDECVIAWLEHRDTSDGAVVPVGDVPKLIENHEVYEVTRELPQGPDDRRSNDGDDDVVVESDGDDDVVVESDDDEITVTTAPSDPEPEASDPEPATRKRQRQTRCQGCNSFHCSCD